MWQGVCARRGRACVTEGHAWQGGMHGRGQGGHAWQGVCEVGVCMVGGGVHGRGQGACMSGRGVRAGETATEADGTHPTGMHSCFNISYGPYEQQIKVLQKCR